MMITFKTKKQINPMSKIIKLNQIMIFQKTQYKELSISTMNQVNNQEVITMANIKMI